MLEGFDLFAAALPEAVNQEALEHLLRPDGQEDLCFAIWYSSHGRRRLTGLISELIRPKFGERIVRGNVSFTADYFTRAVRYAAARNAGLALMHSHPGRSWQELSEDDFAAEASHAGATLGATNYPLLGLTTGSDGAWSARFWRRIGPHKYEPLWCESVRAVGLGLAMTYHPVLRQRPSSRPELERSIGVWGEEGQAQIARLRVGIVGLGNVGSIVCEALARMGIEELSLIDYDEVDTLNLDRMLYATHADIGRLKIEVARESARCSSTAARVQIEIYEASVAEPDGYQAALDCDVLFSCVDRSWPRRVLNHIAYAHVIPVIDGGIGVRVRGQRLLGADWQVHTVGPKRRCLECLDAFDPSSVAVERDGWLEDPSYLKQLDPEHVLLRHENVFPFGLHVAALEVLNMAALVLGPIHNLGNQNYHYASGTLDRTDDHGCEDTCPYPLIVASGDSYHSVTGLDPAAERHRRNRARAEHT